MLRRYEELPKSEKVPVTFVLKVLSLTLDSRVVGEVLTNDFQVIRLRIT